jgi:hypothetical protein
MPVQPGAQFEQLPMFMSAREITQQYAPAETDKHWLSGSQRSESSDELWDRKAKEAETGVYGDRPYKLRSGERGTLYDSIKEEGIEKPVPLGRTQVIDGHHRVAAQFAIDPDKQVPVTHREGGIQDMWAEQANADKARQDAQTAKYAAEAKKLLAANPSLSTGGFRG